MQNQNTTIKTFFRLFYKQSRFLSVLFLIFINCMHTSYAYNSIQIVGGLKQQPTVAVVNFNLDINDNNNPVKAATSTINSSAINTSIALKQTDKSIADIITNDLNITGEFNVLRYDTLAEVPANTQYIITGSISNAGLVKYALLQHNSIIGNLKIATTQINNLAKQNNNTTLLNQQFTLDSYDFYQTNKRYIVHLISNAVYEKLTKSFGIFTSKIAYITKNNNQYQVIVADYDGYNKRAIVTSAAPLSSLSWSKDDTQIAYTSFESGKPVVYIQNIYQKNRFIVANFKGSNSAPSFLIKDSSKIAVTLSKDVGSHIYLLTTNAFTETTQASLLIKYGLIDTEASFNKNDDIVFTSNHDGGPQIFMTNLHDTSNIQRLTINLGNYNTSAKFSHSGTKITFINRDNGILKAYVMDLTSIPYLTYPVNMSTVLDMAPSFAPNDKLILFSSNNGLYIVNTLGTIKTELKNIKSSQQIIDQCWSNTI